jgi:hypothetical protein
MQVGFADDLHQRDTGPVEVHETDLDAILGRPMEETTGVFLDVDAGDPGAAERSSRLEFKVTTDAERQIVLRNLVSLGEIGVDVVLAVEFTERRDFAVEGETGQDAELDRGAIDDR